METKRPIQVGDMVQIVPVRVVQIHGDCLRVCADDGKLSSFWVSADKVTPCDPPQAPTHADPICAKVLAAIASGKGRVRASQIAKACDIDYDIAVAVVDRLIDEDRIKWSDDKGWYLIGGAK